MRGRRSVGEVSGGSITVRGARQHTLRGVDLTLDPGELTVFVGPSGSGKSSLAFDTLHAEGQRRYLEALSARVRAGLVELPRPEVDLVAGLPPTVALDQRADPPGGRSTVGSWSELDVVLRVLFGRRGTLRDPETGAPVEVTSHDTIVATILQAAPGTRLWVEAPLPLGPGALEDVVRGGFSRVRVDGDVVRVEEVPPGALDGAESLRVVVDRVVVRADRADRIHDAVRTALRAGGGVVVAVLGETPHRFADRPLSASGQPLPDLSPRLLLPRGPGACGVCEGRGRVEDAPCAACDGSGLGPVARAVTFGGASWAALRARPLAAWPAWLDACPRDAVAGPLLDELARRVGALLRVDLGHLAVDRSVGTLSTGERQRLRLASLVGGDLRGVLYVLDEPTAGLDDGRVAGVVALLRTLRDRGNAVVVVEHHPDVVDAADHVVEFGPGPGLDGGRVVFEGTPADLRTADTATGRALRRGPPEAPPAGASTGTLRLEDLDDPRVPRTTLALPEGRVTVLTGPSGAGATTLLDLLAAHVQARLRDEAAPPGRLVGGEDLARVVAVDDLAARRSRRSTPATYTGLWDVLRELLAATQEARVRGLSPSHFSLNVAGGRCEACRGLGVTRVDLDFLPSVDVVCAVCDGRRFTRDVLGVRWKGHDAAALLALRADEALAVLAGHPRLEEALRALRDVGLGYLPLGQPVHTLSGGEAQRLKLARELGRAAKRGAQDTLFLLDQPTAGLHPQDVDLLVALLHRLADEGATVVVASHDRRMVAGSGHVIPVRPD